MTNQEIIAHQQRAKQFNETELGSKMRYYSYNEFDPDSPRSDASGGYVETVSEDDVRRTYWPYWYKKMCEKFGQEFIDSKYSFEDCLTDWITVNWAWPVLDNEEYDREKSRS